MSLLHLEQKEFDSLVYAYKHHAKNQRSWSKTVNRLKAEIMCLNYNTLTNREITEKWKDYTRNPEVRFQLEELGRLVTKCLIIDDDPHHNQSAAFKLFLGAMQGWVGNLDGDNVRWESMFLYLVWSKVNGCRARVMRDNDGQFAASFEYVSFSNETNRSVNIESTTYLMGLVRTKK